MLVDVSGFLTEPKRLPNGELYRGRLTLPDVQWTGRGEDVFATVTITAEQIVDAADSRLLWTDQSVQRGVSPTAPSGVPRELPLSDGYPDSRYYIFDAGNADNITDKILRGDRLFLNSLIWNLRPGTFEAFWSEDDASIFLYHGKIFLPDSHHRHQAIIKAVRAFRDHPAGYPKFEADRQFKVELYFLNREDEGDYFFDKNQRPKPTAQSKAYDLTTQDDLSILAKRVLDLAPWLDAGVNRATDRLSKKAPHFMTLSTLRELMKTFAASDEVDEAELEGLATVAADFFELLAAVRPELRVGTSWADRDATLASAAVMLHGYAALMFDYNLDIGNAGRDRARELWQQRLARLAPSVLVRYDSWSGDFLDKASPLWEATGITKRNPETQRITVLNTGGSRSRAGRTLRRYLEAGQTVSDLRTLTEI